MIRRPAESVGSPDSVQNLDLLSIRVIPPELTPLLSILLIWHGHTSVEHSTVRVGITIVESGNVVLVLWQGF